MFASIELIETGMQTAIARQKWVAITLHRFATSAKHTMANIMDVGRSTVNLIFREFCATVVHHLAWFYVKFLRDC